MCTRCGRSMATPLMSPELACSTIFAKGFKPYVVCGNESETIECTRMVLGVGLRVCPLEGLALVGWVNNGDVLSSDTHALLASFERKDIIVFMDKKSRKRTLSKPT